MPYPTVTEHSKLYPFTSVMASPYSCDNTGTSDCAAAIEEIKANQSNVGTLYFPHGTYKIATNLTIPSGMEIVYEAGAQISISTGVTLTINCAINGPHSQLFVLNGTAAVSISKPLSIDIEGFWFSSLSAAVTAIGSTECTLNVPIGDWPVTGDVTVPSTCVLRVAKGADIQIATTKTLTISGVLDAGPYKIFSCTGTGKVAISNSRVYLEWWTDNATPGTTSMLTAYNAATDAGQYNTIWLQDIYLLDGAATITNSNLTFTGPGKLIGSTYAYATGSTIPTSTITATGTLGSLVSYGSAIAIAETSFTVDNSGGTISAGDMVLLSNAPATAADKRNEVLYVLTANATTITTTPVVQTFADTTSLGFKKITPVENLHFEAPYFENLSVHLTRCRGVSIDSAKALRSFVSFNQTCDSHMNFRDFDAGNSIALAHAGDMSRNFSISGNFKGARGVSGNALVKTNGACFYSIDANVCHTTNDGGTMSAFLADVYYASNPTGYDYQLNAFFKVNINSYDVYGVAVEISGNTGTPTDTCPHDFYVAGQFGDNGVNVKYSSYGTINGQNNSSGYIALTGCDNIRVVNNDFAGFTDGGSNTNIQGVWVAFTPTIGGTGTFGTGQAYTTQVGRYIKTGKKVEATGTLVWTGVGTAVGNTLIGGLPYAAENVSNISAVVNVGLTSGLTRTNGITAICLANTTTAQVYYDGLTALAIPATGTLTFSVTYNAAS